MAEPYYVILDVESTGLLFTNPDIVELSAISLEPDETGLPQLFDAFLQPTKDLTKEATSINGLYRRHNCLFNSKEGKEVFTESPPQVLKDFLSWLKKLQSNNIYILAYNAFKFDAPLLLQHFERYSIPYSQVIRGVCDPLVGIQRLPSLGSLSKKSLLDVCQTLKIHVRSRELHSGFYDSVLLRNLVKKLRQEWGNAFLKDCSMTLQQFKSSYFKDFYSS
ncbi:three prime repair exonuclease 2-like [Lepeophtheirus salmonis]